MACYHPLHAFEIGQNLSGKPKYQIESGTVLRVHPKIGHRLITDQWLTDFIEIPCGKCIGCRLDYSRQWANRCMLEAKNYKDNAFLTLTYEEQYLVKNKGVDIKTGEILDVPTLIPQDLTKFMKDLRRFYKYHYDIENIRFYACGEYGETYQRPHFHLICFNLPIFDKQYLFSNKIGDKIYISDTIKKIWGKGIISIGDVTWNSAAYVARYVMKKIKGPEAKDLYRLMGKEPEFVRMSRNHGIGYDYFQQNKESIYETDEIIITNKEGLAQKIKPGKYYDRLYDLDSPEAMKAIKNLRKEAAQNAMQLQLEKTNKSKEEYLETKERNKIESIKALKRGV